MTGRLSGGLGGWRLALRIAARDALRHRGRSLLVLAMIALPVAAVAVADTVYSTSDISGTEAVERRIGTADARVELPAGTNRVYQLPDPEDGVGYAGSGREDSGIQVADVRDVLGSDRPLTRVREASLRYETEAGVGDAQVLELDVQDPLTRGLVTLTGGSWPATTDEVVVNQDLADRDPGQELTLTDGTTLTIVGTAESTRYTGVPRAVGLPGAFDLGRRAQESVLVGGGPVTWQQVRELNGRGGVVTSRAVLAAPPPADQLPAELQLGGGLDGATVTVLVLVVVMVLLEVVLLAGPAFAVGARRQARTLALVAAAGGTPAQTRRVVLASGVVLGVAAAVLGVGLGIPAAAASMPLFQLVSDTRFGPFDVEPLHLAVVVGFGVLSALLAAGVPAWLASRQDVVAVLAARRGDARPSRRSPVLGLVLLGGGVGAAAYGASRGTDGGGEVPIAAGAVLCVLGMILLVPVVVALAARLARRLPLPLRFAARDAARHRTRTVPAVAAVAATVAGVVALGIAITSDEAQNRQTYRASLPLGAATVTDYRASADLDAHAAVVRDLAPGLEVERLQGVAERRAELRLSRPDGQPVLFSYGGSFASSVLVADRVPEALLALDDDQRRAADAVLAEGGVLAFTQERLEDTASRVVLRGFGREETRTALTVPAVFVPVEDGYSTVKGVVSPEVADRLGARVVDAGLYLPGPVPAATAADLTEAVSALGSSASFYVERGYQAPDETVVVQLVLGALGAVLMLGGTLTATFLALSDARPDLATLAAVGAGPRTRRGVAAAYALVVGLVGAVLGALVGAVPGVAITYPLTGPYDDGMGLVSGPSHYLDVPWTLVLGVVVGLPLLTAALVGLTARSRLPLAARLE